MTMVEFFGIQNGAKVYLTLASGQSRQGTVREVLIDDETGDPLGLRFQSGHGFEVFPWHAVTTIQPTK